jgi:hypothetical protein
MVTIGSVRITIVPTMSIGPVGKGHPAKMSCRLVPATIASSPIFIRLIDVCVGIMLIKVPINIEVQWAFSKQRIGCAYKK